jgi:hypothetical protein
MPAHGDQPHARIRRRQYGGRILGKPTAHAGLRQMGPVSRAPRSVGLSAQLEMKVEASVARCLRTPPDGAYPARALNRYFRPLTQPEPPEHSCHWQLCLRPITLDPFRAKARLLRPRRSYFAPAGVALEISSSGEIGSASARGSLVFSDTGGGAGYCPRVRKVYYDGNLSP